MSFSGKVITVALAKGYLLPEAMSLFEKIGLSCEDDLVSTRKLFSFSKDQRVRFLLVRPWDVPVYVAQGAADIGIVGKDVLLEQAPKVLQLLDLKFGQCKLVLAGPLPSSDQVLTHHLKIATKYPHMTQTYFASKGLKIILLKLYGAIELAPITGLSDLICDLTATGKTLQENGLHIVDTVFSSSAQLIANPVSLKLNYSLLTDWVDRLKAVLNV